MGIAKRKGHYFYCHQVYKLFCLCVFLVNRSFTKLKKSSNDLSFDEVPCKYKCATAQFYKRLAEDNFGYLLTIFETERESVIN